MFAIASDTVCLVGDKFFVCIKKNIKITHTAEIESIIIFNKLFSYHFCTSVVRCNLGYRKFGIIKENEFVIIFKIKTSQYSGIIVIVAAFPRTHIEICE